MRERKGYSCVLEWVICAYAFNLLDDGNQSSLVVVIDPSGTCESEVWSHGLLLQGGAFYSHPATGKQLLYHLLHVYIATREMRVKDETSESKPVVWGSMKKSYFECFKNLTQCSSNWYSRKQSGKDFIISDAL